MRTLALLSLLLLVPGCGSEMTVLRAPEDPDQGLDNPGPERKGDACSSEQKRAFVDGREICVPQPRALRLVDFSLTGLSLSNPAGTCAALQGFVSDFAKLHLGGANLTWGGCIPAPSLRKGFLVYFSLKGSGDAVAFSFVTGFRQEPGDTAEAPVIHVCPAGERSNDAACKEGYVFGAVPSDVARSFPNPHPGMVHFYPTLLSFLRR